MSAKFSPFLIEALSISAMLIVAPPSLCIAASKLSRVRVLGSKNSVERIFPLRMSEVFAAMGSMVLLTFMM